MMKSCWTVEAVQLCQARCQICATFILQCSASLFLCRGIGAIVYRVPELENDEMLKISLRSVDIEDTTPISEGFGGGGHRNASSFMICSAEFERWKVGKSASF
ncbi:DHHA1 DOMAIN PROTEIN [Salix purpurea]|uniref:DHHA1 DOMAIN PROTEIN n=1 Tax=Salix purpurea TaxID=77065 RepID=A0A9Q0W3T1_SALPP|nr:DHHA1 DOMAIN PROTEIN [Salix purpurea]